MSLQAISAIYEGGVFKPLHPIKLPDHQRLRLIVETERNQFSSSYLTSEEILALANKRAVELRRKPRKVIVKQHQELIKALQAEAITKGIKINDYPDEE